MKRRGLLGRIFNRRGQVWDTLIPWIIALAVLALGLILFFTLSDAGSSALSYFRDLWRFR